MPILPKLHNRFLVISLLAILMGCATTRYNNEKLSSLHKKGYEIKLNGKTINPRLHYLDPDNLSTPIKHRKIVQLMHTHGSPTWVSLHSLSERYERQKPSERILVVIDGIAIDDFDFDSVRIEQSSIQSLDYLSPDKIADHMHHRAKGVLIVKTKQ